MILICIIALPGETGEIRHGFAIVIGRGHLQLIYLQIKDLSGIIKEYISHHFIKAVDTGILIIGSRAKPSVGIESQTVGDACCLDFLLRGAFFGSAAGLFTHGGADGVEYTV